MVHIEYRYPWAKDHWRSFASAADLHGALTMLDACRVEHPGSECRIRSEKGSLGACGVRL
jgi:hypothetical protein